MESKISQAFAIFDQLYNEDPNQKIVLAFSGGKDSHTLLGVYIQWMLKYGRKLEGLTVVFADTHMESIKIYELVSLVEARCNELGIAFKRAVPNKNHNFWIMQFIRGYAVPNHKIRWCTSYLKRDPLKKVKGRTLTGRHYGESASRDARLNKGCGSTECGMDKLGKTIDPIVTFRNCDIWDWIFFYGDTAFYEGFMNKISTVYDISNSTGSLRYGCVVCPVIAVSTMEEKVSLGQIPPEALEVRAVLESLRSCPRMVTKKGTNGAIFFKYRQQHWEMLKPLLPHMLDMGIITNDVIEVIEKDIQTPHYPPTYDVEWAKQQEENHFLEHAQ